MSRTGFSEDEKAGCSASATSAANSYRPAVSDALERLRDIVAVQDEQSHVDVVSRLRIGGLILQIENEKLTGRRTAWSLLCRPMTWQRSSQTGPTHKSPSDLVTGSRRRETAHAAIYGQGPSVSPCARCAGTAFCETTIVTNAFVCECVW